MHPILLRLGPFTIYSYSVALTLAMGLATWLIHRRCTTCRPAPQIVLDGAFWVLLGGILGGRAGYVLGNWAYFADHLRQGLDLTAGGLSWHGGLAGGGLAFATWYMVRQRHTSISAWQELADAAAPALALGGMVGWLGCLFAGVGYGAPAAGYGPPLSWLTAYLPDIYGVERIRFVTQAMMASWCLLLAGGLWVIDLKLPPGATFSLYLFLYASADFGIMFLRGDGTWKYGLWLSQWAAVIEICTAIAIGLTAWIKPGNNHSVLLDQTGGNV